METMPKLLTVREAAELSRLSKSKIYQLFDQGVLRRLRLPGCAKVLLCEDELRRYIRHGIQAGLATASA
jgi:excisionase family DNA binding protein